MKIGRPTRSGIDPPMKIGRAPMRFIDGRMKNRPPGDEIHRSTDEK
jgi:hypothetical protein